MSRSNVVSVSFSTPECRSQVALEALVSAEVVAFPRPAAKLPESQSFAARQTIHGTFAWACEVVAADRRLSFAIVDARKRVNRLMHETCSRPSFAAHGLDHKAFRDAVAQWEATRKRYVFSTGLEAMAAEWREIQKDTGEAYEILRAAGIDPGHYEAADRN